MKAYFHDDQKLHHPRTYFSRGKMRTPQEVPSRLDALAQAARNLGFDVQAPPDHGSAPLEAVHSPAYLRFLQEAHAAWKKLPEDWGDEVVSNVFVREPNALRGVLAQAARYLADGSCPVGPDTWQSAYWSAQCAIAGADRIAAGDRHAYALCRPPGHHARRDAAGGFCYLNNAAIAAQRLRDTYGRVAILDTDMHHGQGIQEIFYERSDVLYVSIHGDPENFYPVVAGFADERGAGAGAGYNLNLPMPHGSPESVFFDRLRQARAAIEQFQPDVLVLSLGFDIFEKDPQAMVAVSEDGFERLGREVAGLKLPTLIVQEGGYYIEGLESNAARFFAGLASTWGRAAQALHLSQPAVSQALKRLEDAVGGMLLHRRNGEFRLTGLGEEIYAIARDMYGTMARIETAALQDRHEVAGTLRLLVMSRIQSTAYDDFLADFHQRHPRIEFHIEVLPSADILDALSKRVPALGLCLCRKPVEALERRLFLRHHYAVVCGRRHPLFSRPRVGIEDLMDQNFVCFASDQIGDTLSPLTIFRDQQGFTGRIVATSPHIEEVRRMVVAGIGLSFLPEHLIVPDVVNGELRRLPPNESVAEIDVFLAWHRQRKLSAAETAYLEAFERFLARTPLAARAR